MFDIFINFTSSLIESQSFSSILNHGHSCFELPNAVLFLYSLQINLVEIGLYDCSACVDCLVAVGTCSMLYSLVSRGTQKNTLHKIKAQVSAVLQPQHNTHK